MNKKEDISSYIIKKLKEVSDSNRSETMSRFFKTAKGEYGEGDLFLGISSLKIQKIVKEAVSIYKNKDKNKEEFYNENYIKDQINLLLENKYHEIRYAGCDLLIRSNLPSEKKVKLYVSACGKGVNNWDLVDVFSSKLSKYVDENTIIKLSSSSNLWKQRASVVLCIYRIKNNDFDLILKLAKLFLNHPHDLQHKVVGWMLREVYKKDPNTLISFLKKNITSMPRTMLRYSIEKMDEKDRKYWLNYKKD